MPKVAAERRGPGRRPHTSREDIVVCAIRMLERNPLETLTFRAVAREMNIAVGAFSRYFKSLAELQDEVAAKIVAGVGPLGASSGRELRDQLLRLSMEWLRITRTYPALVTFHGPASATAVAEHLGQVVKVMAGAGVDAERAMMIYGMIVNLAYSWGMQLSRPPDKALQKKSVQAFARQAGDLAPQFESVLGKSAAADVYHRSFVLLIDGLLPEQSTPSRKR